MEVRKSTKSPLGKLRSIIIGIDIDDCEFELHIYKNVNGIHRREQIIYGEEARQLYYKLSSQED